MAHENHWPNRGFHCVFCGPLDVPELHRGIDEFYSDPRSERCRYMIVDFAAATLPEIPKLENAKFAALDKGGSAYITEFKQAFVATSPQVRGFAEEHIERLEKLGVPWEFAVFDTLEAAQEWVGD
jgi:hypothetical protein